MRTASMQDLIGWVSGFINPGKTIAGLVGGAGASAVVWYKGLPEATEAVGKALVLMMVLDILLGVATAIKAKKFTLKGFSSGLYKLPVYAVVVLFGSALDWIVEGVGVARNPLFFVNWGLAFLAIREALSVVEHMAELDVPMPPGWRKALRQLKRQVGQEGPDGNGGSTADGGSQESGVRRTASGPG